jgi:hypothetical protein
MARKYTKLVFVDDENEIKKIISDIKPNLKYLNVSYVRDDRIINLTNNEIAVGSNPWDTTIGYDSQGISMSLYRHGGIVAVDRIRNGSVDADGNLIGRKVNLDLAKSGNIEMSIESYVIINPVKGYINASGYSAEQLIEELRSIKEYEHIVNEMELIYPYYEEYSSGEFAKLWYTISKFNLFDQLDQYANLLTYIDDYRIQLDSETIWDAIKIPEPFRFSLNNYYLTNNHNGERFYLSKFQEGAELHKFYTGLPTDNCREVFIDCAEKERYTLRAIERTLSYRGQSILNQIAKSPEFFCDCLKKLKLTGGQDNIIEQYSYYVTQLEKHSMALKFDNISRLSIVDKASEMYMDTSDFFNLLNSLSTKEGLLNYVKQEYHK